VPREVREFDRQATREQFLVYIRQLERQLGEAETEIETRDRELAQLRSCTDHQCYLCPECVVALFLRTRPTPLTLPRKYVEHSGGVRVP
jgi:hypothetical protein